MNENVFIIGNGFDLDLGWETRFSDFANSSYWPKEFPMSELQTYLEDKRHKQTWFDLENELLSYSLNTHGIIRESLVQADLIYFKRLHQSVTKYLAQQQELPILTNSVAAIVLKAICLHGYFYPIYSFNYTDLNKIAHSLNIEKQISYNHIHGSLSDNSIIIGVDESDLKPGYEEFHKTVSSHYRSHTIIDDLQVADNIVFFGISFGQIDYIYFDSLFKSLADSSLYNRHQRKKITIFTYDDKSRINILTNLKKMGIDRLRLLSQCDFQIIRTSVPEDNVLIEDFIKRLLSDSTQASRQRIKTLESLRNYDGTI